MGDCTGLVLFENSSPALPAVAAMGLCREGMQQSLVPPSIPESIFGAAHVYSPGDMNMAIEVKIPGIFPLDLSIFTFPLCPVTPFSSCAYLQFPEQNKSFAIIVLSPNFFFLCLFVLLSFFFNRKCSGFQICVKTHQEVK